MKVTSMRIMLGVGVGAALAANASGAGTVPPEHRVALQIFYRAFCPACEWFVTDPLPTLMNDPEFRSIVDFDLRPVAGMFTRDNALECEGEEDECQGHRWEGCVIHTRQDDIVKMLAGVSCMEKDNTEEFTPWETKVQQCFDEKERTVLLECYQHESENLLRKWMDTPIFEKVEWMPFVVVNGKVQGTIDTGVGIEEVQSGVCSAFKGPKEYLPKVCQDLVKDPEQLAPADVKTDKAAVTPKMLDPAGVNENTNAVTPKMLAPADVHDDDNGAVTPKMLDPAEKKKSLSPADKKEVPSHNAGDTNAKVRLDMYWRAFCPGCRGFMTGPLQKLIHDDELRNIIDLNPIPSVGVKYDSTKNPKCMSGPFECEGHRWISCAIDLFPTIEVMVKYLVCMEAATAAEKSSWEEVVTKCFTSSAKSKMQTCFDNRSASLLKMHVEASRKDIAWSPFVVVDGTVLGDIKHGIDYKTLESAICAAYKGDASKRPHACQAKRLRDAEEPETAVKPCKGKAEETTEKVVKPCKQKKGDDKEGELPKMVEDAPGIGARPDAREPDETPAETLQIREDFANRALDEARAGAPSFRVQSLLVPLVFFLAIVLIARRLSGDHKKHA